MSLEAILDPKVTHSKNKRVPSKVLTKPKEADVPCHMRPLTHAPSATQVRNGLVGSRASVKEFVKFTDLKKTMFHTLKDNEQLGSQKSLNF